MVKNPPANAGEMGSIPGSGRSLGEANDNLLQYSCLENLMDTGTWQAIVHGVARVRYDLAKEQHSIYSIVFMRFNLANYILLGPRSDVTYL